MKDLVNDFISRQDAVDIIGMDKIEPEIPPSLGSTAERDFKIYNHSCNKHIELIKQLPSAQTDLSGYSDRLWKTAYDRGYERCRQDAIDALKICDSNYDGINCHKCPLRDTRWDGAWYDEETTCYTKLMRDSAKLLGLPSATQETFEWCHDCKEYDQEQHCCHRWTKQIRKTIAELEADYPQAMKDELEYWKERAAKLERDYYIKIKGIRKHVPNIDLEEVEEDEIN